MVVEGLAWGVVVGASLVLGALLAARVTLPERIAATLGFAVGYVL